MDNEYRKYGRRKAGTYGKPHKHLRDDANRAVRVRDKRIVNGEINETLSNALDFLLDIGKEK